MKQEDIEKLSSLIIEIFNKYADEPEIETLFEEMGDLYFSAPGSSRTEYHDAFPGGLAKHSLSVFKNLVKLNKTFDYGFDMRSMVVCSFFHDLGKAATTNMTPYYVPAEEWLVDKGQPYSYSKNGVYMQNHLRSIYFLQKYRVQLNPDEFMAIFLNDGMYVSGNRSYGMKEPKLAVALHMADRLAADSEESQEN